MMRIGPFSLVFYHDVLWSRLEFKSLGLQSDPGMDVGKINARSGAVTFERQKT